MSDREVVESAALERLLRIGGQDFLLEMIALFLDNAPERIRAAQAGLASGDLQAVYRASHSLKSTAGNLGARGLQEAAESLEKRAKAQKAEGLEAMLADVASRYEAVRERLEAERKRRSGG